MKICFYWIAKEDLASSSGLYNSICCSQFRRKKRGKNNGMRTMQAIWEKKSFRFIIRQIPRSSTNPLLPKNCVNLNLTGLILKIGFEKKSTLISLLFWQCKKSFGYVKNQETPAPAQILRFSKDERQTDSAD